MEQTTKRRAFFWPWQFEDKERLLDAWSQDGWQLEAGGRFLCRCRNDTDIRYRYRMAMLGGDVEAAAQRYAKQRWELVNTAGGWSYFRKPWDAKLPEAVYTLPDAEAVEDRIEACFRRIMRRCVILIALCCVIAAGFAVWGYIRKIHLWQVAMPFAVVVIACFFPYIKLEGWLEKKGRLKPESQKKRK